MPEPPSLDELSRRFLDLWQQQISAWAADPDLARNMGAWLEAWTKAAGIAPRGGGLDLEHIEKRLAVVERRLAELEPKPRARARKRPASKPRRRRR